MATISSFGPVVALGFFAGIAFWNVVYVSVLKFGVSRLPRFELAVLVASLVLLAFGMWFLYNGFHLLA
ncbi:MAG: hypothetical protein JRN52_14215 [Nitrososphaerota archaeon]|nr:hypothetical protein [Nitrososphaerota archaeon]